MAKCIKAEELVPFIGTPRQDLTGRIFKRLTVSHVAGRLRRGNQSYVIWCSICECGNIALSRTSDLVSGDTGSCGCRQIEAVKRTMTTHGHANKHPLYRTWKAMRRRCLGKNTVFYHNYGGRGIKVLEPWLSDFESFRQDMVESWQPGLTIERIDTNGHYCKDNCRWATKLEQACNTRRSRFLTVGGLRLTVSQWARKVGCSHTIIHSRLKRGWTPEDAVNGRHS